MIKHMGQQSRIDFLQDLGYEEPFDDSPVEVPNGWHGGKVVNTGGNMMCRIWQTWESSEKEQETEYEIIYNISQDASVALQAYTWDKKYDAYIFDHEIKVVEAGKNTDPAQAEVARELMLEHSNDLD